jgi:hypothetical protein
VKGFVASNLSMTNSNHFLRLSTKTHNQKTNEQDIYEPSMCESNIVKNIRKLILMDILCLNYRNYIFRIQFVLKMFS